MSDDEYMVDDIFFEEDDVDQPNKPKIVTEVPTPTITPTQQPNKSTDGLSFDPTAHLLNTKTNRNMYDEIEKREKAMGDAPIDFSRLNDPSYTGFVEQFMKLKRRKSNMMTLDEFNRYRPIFDPNSSMSSQDKQNLFVAWQHRVSLRDPVEVYDRGERVLIIPPTVADTNTISTVGHNAASGIVDGFYNANELEFDINNRQQHWGNKMIQAFNYAQDQNRLEDQRGKAELLAKQALGVAEPVEPQNDGNVSNNNSDLSHTTQQEDEVDEFIDEEYL